MNNKNIYIISICIFLFFYYFFTHSVPLVFGDGDDWNYLSYTRSVFLFIGEHNPTKIFTESLMSINADIATSIIMPFSNDLCSSISIISAITLSLCITLYILAVISFLKQIIGLNQVISVFISIIFLLFHFLIFRTEELQNDFMFYSWDLTCYYHYTIPNILSASFVLLYLHQSPLSMFKEKKYLHLGIFFLITFIVLTSNLYSSIIFISYIIAKLLYQIIKNFKKFQTTLKENIFELIILFAWGIIHLIEMIFGGRSSLLLNQNNNSEYSLWDRILQSFQYLYNKLSDINTIFLSLSIIAIIFIICHLRKNKYNDKLIYTFIIAGLINVFYLIILSANVYPYYMVRPEVLFGPCFYIFILVCISFSLQLKYTNILKLILPLFCFILILECRTPGKTYKNTIQGYSPEYWTQMNRYIISKVQAAEKEGLEEVIINVPKYEETTNWPLPTWTGKKIARALYKHNLIERPIEIKIIPNSKFNNKD